MQNLSVFFLYSSPQNISCYFFLLIERSYKILKRIEARKKESKEARKESKEGKRERNKMWAIWWMW